MAYGDYLLISGQIFSSSIGPSSRIPSVTYGQQKSWPFSDAWSLRGQRIKYQGRQDRVYAHPASNKMGDGNNCVPRSLHLPYFS